eukprot:TRINITY_DN6174_c0_g1_i1.p1 TRINITY_DN6174_c0_g1~~TRINITY_DN6174_c0_g1_i1.p1  ORF type:complete len:195 (+),score=-20.23 TRINITY_DN6174_c0_g1_i1:858-1442(+)
MYCRSVIFFCALVQKKQMLYYFQLRQYFVTLSHNYNVTVLYTQFLYTQFLSDMHSFCHDIVPAFYYLLYYLYGKSCILQHVLYYTGLLYLGAIFGRILFTAQQLCCFSSCCGFFFKFYLIYTQYKLICYDCSFQIIIFFQFQYFFLIFIFQLSDNLGQMLLEPILKYPTNRQSIIIFVLQINQQHSTCEHMSNN